VKTSFTVIAEVVDPLLVGKPAAKDFLSDVEPHGAGFALVIRSQDKAVVGKTDRPEACAFKFNDNAGRMIPYVVATSPTRAVLDKAAAQLIAFYSAPASASFSERFDPMGDAARAVLPVVMSVFGIAPRTRNGWKVGSVKLLQPAKPDAIRVAAKSLNNRDAVALSDAVANAAGSPQPREVVARVAEILQTVRAPKHILVAA
jgi:hypothetical protein